MGLVKLNDRGVRSATAFGSVSGGSFTFIKKLTASASGTLDFVDGTSDVVLYDTYKEYLFTFKDIHPGTDSVDLSFQGNAAGGADYNETITSTFFRAYHGDDDGGATLAYYATLDQAQGTGFQALCENVGNDNDSQLSGYLHLFNPSSTTFVKNFISRFNGAHPSDNSMSIFSAGYYNTTSALNTFRFKMTSGNIDAGTIKLYGLKDS